MNGRTALQYSCDTWYYKVADTIGLDPIAEMGKALGLGAPTGIGVLAEVPGIMPSSEYHNKASPGGYTKGMALNSAIGQGDDNVTPLQLAMVYAAIGNGGTLYKPQLVERVEGLDGEVLAAVRPAGGAQGGDSRRRTARRWWRGWSPRRWCRAVPPTGRWCSRD